MATTYDLSQTSFEGLLSSENVSPSDQQDIINYLKSVNAFTPNLVVQGGGYPLGAGATNVTFNTNFGRLAPWHQT
jgi:hypothetical protein